MSAIDAARSTEEPLVLDQTSAVCVKAEPAGVVGELAHVDGTGPRGPQGRAQRFVRT